jgi:predicted PurR-regulated permease PerM
MIPSPAPPDNEIEKERGGPAGEPALEASPLGPVALTYRSRSANRATTGLFVLLLIYALHFATPIVLPIAVALLLAFILSPPLRLLSKLLPVPLAAGIVVLMFVGVIGGGFFALSSPAADWIEALPHTMQRLERKLETLKGPLKEMTAATAQMEELTRLDETAQAPRPVEIRQPGFIRLTLRSTPPALVSVAVTIVLLYFTLASGREIIRKLATPKHSELSRRRVIAVVRQVEGDISRYLVTVSGINICLGAATAGMLYLFGIPNAPLWGVVVCLLNFAPYVGATISAVLLAIVAFLTFDSIGHALLVPAAFVVLAIIEGQLVTPSIVGRRLSMSPLVVVLSVLFCGWLWGAVGALIAVPLLASIKIVCQHVPQWRKVADIIGRGSPGQRKRRRAYGSSRLSPE